MFDEIIKESYVRWLRIMGLDSVGSALVENAVVPNVTFEVKEIDGKEFAFVSEDDGNMDFYSIPIPVGDESGGVTTHDVRTGILVNNMKILFDHVRNGSSIEGLESIDKPNANDDYWIAYFAEGVVSILKEEYEKYKVKYNINV